MKRPHQGIRSTSIKQPRLPPSGRKNTTVQAAPIADKEIWIDDISEPSFHAGPIDQGPSVIVEDDNSSLGNIFALLRLQTSAQECYTTISPGRSPTCPLREMYVTSSHTTTNPMQFLVSQYPVLMTKLFLQRTKHSSNFWKAKDTR